MTVTVDRPPTVVRGRAPRATPCPHPDAFSVSADGHRLRFTAAAGATAVTVAERGLVMACGAVVAHLRLSLLDLGLPPQVLLLGRLDSADLVTVLSRPRGPQEDPDPAPDEPRAAGAVPSRGTCRPLPATSDLDRFVAVLQSQVAVLGVRVDPVPDASRSVVLADRVATHDHPLLDAPVWRPARERCGGHETRVDPTGPDGGRISIEQLAGRCAPARGRASVDLTGAVRGAGLDLDGRSERTDLVLSTRGDSSSDWAATGQAVARLSVLAPRSGLQAVVMEHRDDPVPLRDPAQDLARDLGGRHGRLFPQLVVTVASWAEASTSPVAPTVP